VAAAVISVKKYVVNLTEDEREQLQDLIRTGKRSAQRNRSHPPLSW